MNVYFYVLCNVVVITTHSISHRSLWLNVLSVYSFEVVEGRQDDLVTSSDQTDSGQQLQYQSLCPDEDSEWRDINQGSIL